MSPTSNPTTKTTVAYGLLLTAILFTICVLAYTVMSGMAGKDSSLYFFISRLLFWLCLGITWLYCVIIERQPLLLWEDRKYTILFGIISVIVLGVVVTAGSTVIRLIAHILHWDIKSATLQALFNFGVPLKIFIAITAAFVEEMIFRGYLMPRLQLFFHNKYWPIIISSLIFGLGHFRYGTFVNVAGPVFIGLVFAIFYQKYRNIKILIICHFLIDFVALMFFSK